MYVHVQRFHTVTSPSTHLCTGVRGTHAHSDYRHSFCGVFCTFVNHSIHFLFWNSEEFFQKIVMKITKSQWITMDVSESYMHLFDGSGWPSYVVGHFVTDDAHIQHGSARQLVQGCLVRFLQVSRSLPKWSHVCLGWCCVSMCLSHSNMSKIVFSGLFNFSVKETLYRFISVIIHI